MCEFISWIEREDKKTGEKKLFYLTDDEVFSDHWKETMECEPNLDAVGHGAIRRYFNLPTHQDKKYNNYYWRERESELFWPGSDEFAYIPKELQTKLRQFTKSGLNRHWGRIFSEIVDEDALAHVVCNAPSEIASSAFKILLPRSPKDNFSYLPIMKVARHCNDKGILKQVFDIMSSAPDNLIDENDWSKVCVYTKSNYTARRAAEKLMEYKGPSKQLAIDSTIKNCCNEVFRTVLGVLLKYGAKISLETWKSSLYWANKKRAKLILDYIRDNYSHKTYVSMLRYTEHYCPSDAFDYAHKEIEKIGAKHYAK